MKFQDDAQNLRARVLVIHVIVIALLAVLGVRLYYLQIARGAYYTERAENQRIRLLPIPATRGVIFDRNMKVLVNSRPIYNIVVSREDVRGKDIEQFVQPFADAFDLDAEALRERVVEISGQPAFESITIKENANPNDIAWMEARGLEYPELRIEQRPQRIYPDNGTLAHVLGYVGEISAKQLESDQYKDKNLRQGDIIGKEGVEAVYDHLLRGQDGHRKVIVDSRGHVQSELEKVEPQAGQDLVITIDSDLQLAAENYLKTTPSQRGVIVATDPNNGEILAMASYPTFDPNLFTQRISTKAGRREYAALLNDPKTPLYNRAIRGRYPSGSTWKIPLGVAGLQQGAISTEHSALACGGGITVGNKFTRCMSSHGTPPLDSAIEHSCDGYFYRLGLKMGIEGIMEMVDEFDLNKQTGIDLPHELISQTPNYWKPRLEAQGRPWTDIRTVYASIGQDTVAVTPLSLLRAINGIAMGGDMYVPHLLKEAREVSATEGFKKRERVLFAHPEPKHLDISEEDHRLVVQGMWNVVNRAGTAARIKMPDFEIAGKTGTAQVVGLGKDTGENKDHAWFVSFAPARKPEISVVVLIENVGFGGTWAAPAARAVYDVHYAKTRNAEVVSTSPQSTRSSSSMQVARR